jgi:hypothetical protein
MKSHYDPIPTQVDSSFLLGRRKDSHELINRAGFKVFYIATMICDVFRNSNTNAKRLQHT